MDDTQVDVGRTGAWRLRGGVIGMLLVSLLAVGAMGWPWLSEGVPEGDLAGAAANLTRWRQAFADGTWAAAWDDGVFCGYPRALSMLGAGAEAAYAPFLLAGDAIQALKWGTLVYLALAGVSAFVLARRLLGHDGLAILAALAYALHPIHLGSAVGSSHPNFPPFYALEPLVVLWGWRLTAAPSARRAAGLALLAALTAWVDMERTAILFVLVGFVWLGLAGWRIATGQGRTLLRPAAMLGLSAVLGAGLLAALLAPALAERPGCAMFSEQVRQSSVSLFSIRNPLYYLDRAGSVLGEAWRALPAEHAHDAGRFYLGWTLLTLTLVAMMFWPRERMRRGVLACGVVGAALALASAQGPFVGYQSLQRVADLVWLQNDVRGAGGLGMVLLLGGGAWALGVSAGIIVWRSRRNATPLAGPLGLLTAGPILVLSACPFAWAIGQVEPFSQMRNPGWFATVGPSLGLSLAAAAGLGEVLRRMPCRGFRVGVTLAALALVGADYWAYRPSFTNLSEASTQAEFARAVEAIRNCPRPGRALCRESYNPQADAIIAFAGRPAAHYWLNWMSPAPLGEFFMQDVFPLLRSGKSVDEGLAQAGWANVRLLLCDLTEGPAAPTSKWLRPLFVGQRYAVYENALCYPYASLLAPDGSDTGLAQTAKVIERQSGRIHVEVEAESRAILVLSESWMPRWRVWVDGRPTAAQAARRAFLGVPLESGRHVVELRYEATAWQAVGLAVSTGAVLMCGWLLVRKGSGQGRTDNE